MHWCTNSCFVFKSGEYLSCTAVEALEGSPVVSGTKGGARWKRTNVGKSSKVGHKKCQSIRPVGDIIGHRIDRKLKPSWLVQRGSGPRSDGTFDVVCGYLYLIFWYLWVLSMYRYVLTLNSDRWLEAGENVYLRSNNPPLDFDIQLYHFSWQGRIRFR